MAENDSKNKSVPQILTEQKGIPASFSMQPQTAEVTATTTVIRS